MASFFDSFFKRVADTHALRREPSGQKRRRDNSDDEDKDLVKAPRATINRQPSDDPKATPENTPRLSAAVLAPSEPVTPVPGPRPTASHPEYAGLRKNIFAEYHRIHREFPDTPPETPEASSSSTDKPAAAQPNLDAIQDRTERSNRDRDSYFDSQNLQAENERLKKEHAEEYSRLQEELTEQKQRRTRLAEQGQRLQEEHDSENEEHRKQLEAVEKALASERQAKETLQNELAIERQAKESLQHEIAIERQAKMNVQNALALEEDTTKMLQAQLSTVRQEKDNLSKSHAKEVRELSAEHSCARKENQYLVDKCTAERKKTQDLERSNFHVAQQVQQALQERDQIENKTIEKVKRSVLIGLLRIVTEVAGPNSLTVDNIAPLLLDKLVATIDGQITLQELVHLIRSYYEQCPNELPKVVSGGQGAVSSGIQSSGPHVQYPALLTPGIVPVAQVSGFPTHQQSSQPQDRVEPVSVMDVDPEAIDPGNVMDVDEDKEPLVFAPAPSGNPFENPVANPFAKPARKQQTEVLQPFQPQVARTTPELMVAEAPHQRKLCRFILHPKGCERRPNCKFMHPGDPDCGISVEAVKFLHQKVLAAQQAVSNVGKSLQKKPDLPQIKDTLDKAQVWYCHVYYKFVVDIIESAQQASLNRDNRINFMEMMHYHVMEGLALAFEKVLNETPKLFPRVPSRKNGLIDASRSLAGWFDPEYKMPKEYGKILDWLEIIDGIINGDTEEAKQVAPSDPAPSVIQEGLDELIREVQDEQASRPQLLPQTIPRQAPSTAGNAASPIPGLLQGLNAILDAGNQRPRDQVNRVPPQRTPNGTPFGSSGGARKSRRGGQNSRGEPY